METLNDKEIKKGGFIYWKYKGKDAYIQSYVQDVIKTDKGFLLELTDSSWWTNYPTRILQDDIDILRKVK